MKPDTARPNDQTQRCSLALRLGPPVERRSTLMPSYLLYSSGVSFSKLNSRQTGTLIDGLLDVLQFLTIVLLSIYCIL